ncbi:MAG: sigma-54 dependent transcriptional regulator [Desulfofustis sp.]|jgi:DNA-binding NtrC family response regulator|nr:sigma-54 dependent transcriptional regulator [Desulfofustis sp.]
MSEQAKILIIDDENTICKACSLILAEQGHSVTSRTSGRAGLRDALAGGYDIVLLDMRLPDMDGMEILAELRSKKPEIQIIVMTGYSSVENAVDAMKTGAFDYLAKPFSDDDIILTVSKAFETKRLRDENMLLRSQLFERFDFNNIVGEDPAVLDVFARIKRVAPTDSTVLITGESGTGKELFAGAIHVHSKRSEQRYVTLDCSTLSDNLLESELFGHVKGAFTGAINDKQGIFSIVNHGTLFLDELSNLTLEIQSKLLRVMESREYKPVGGSSTLKTDVRIIAATNRDLSELVADGSFREDLYYRLNVFPIHIPALRERKEDIPRLAYHFLRLFCRQTGKKIEGFSDDALAALIGHPWPGNVRQLKNTVERLVIMADNTFLDSESLATHIHSDDPSLSSSRASVPETLDDLKTFKKDLLENTFGLVEKRFLLKALDDCRGNITHAATKVGMQRSNFSALMKKHGISTDTK